MYTAAATAAITVAEETADRSSLQQQQQQQQQGLRLRSFSSSFPKAVDMLAVQQVQHLTRVELGFNRAMTDSSALSMALARFSNLQQLQLGGISDTSLGAALTTLVQLPQLTLLECIGWWREVPLALQQLLAQPLPLRSLKLSDFRGFGIFPPPIFNMPLLTNLTELSTSRVELAEATVLRMQLQRLQFHSWGGADSMAPVTRLELKQLQHLSLQVDFQQPQLLLQLAQLPALTHLALQYDERCQGQPAAATASAWPLLPQLHELEIAHGTPPSPPEWEAILAAAAAATGLTKLMLDARMMSDEQWLPMELQEVKGEGY
jgi:hypothetical protein